MPDLAPRLVDGEVLFAIRLDFEPGTEDPSRVFSSMAKTIEAFHRLDLNLAHSVALEIHPVQILEDIEAGSIKVWLRTVLTNINDEALRTLDWRPQVGQYLVRGKHLILDWLRERDRVESAGELDALEARLLELAGETNVLPFPSYSAIPRKGLLNDLEELSEAVEELRPGETLTYESPLGPSEVNTGFRLNKAEVEDLLTAETTTFLQHVVMLVKKPDYLGDSMWEFRLGGHTVSGKMLDDAWLKRFRERHIDIRPGDALRAHVQVELKRAANGSIVAARYNILQVEEVIPDARIEEISLLEGTNEFLKLLPPSEDE